MNSLITMTGIFLGTALASYAFVAIFHGWVIQKNIVDVPNHRSSHDKPTPKGGGVAIVMFTLIGFGIVASLFSDYLPASAVFAYVGSAMLIAIVSWIDDLREISAKVRFATHLSGAIFAVITLGYFDTISLPLAGTVSIGWFGMPLTLFWIVLLTNLYNFMDGVDGLAGTQTVIGAIGWLILGILSGQPLVIYLGLFIAASTIGFLWHNWHPAQIFMGDVGSAFLGFTFAVLPLMFYNLTSNAFALPLAICLFFGFLFDGIFTLISRLRRRENIFVAHRTHLYQRLNIAGQNHDQITVLYLFLGLLGLVFTVLLYLFTQKIAPLIAVCIALACSILWYFVSLKEGQSPDAIQHHDDEGLSIGTTLSAQFASPTGVLPRNRYFFLLDVVSLLFVPFLALVLRLDALPPDEQVWQLLLVYTIGAMTIRLVVFYALGLYERYWRYASVDELAQIVSLVGLTTVIITAIYLAARYFISDTVIVPRSLPILDGALSLLAIGGSRYSVRLLAFRRNIAGSEPGKKALVMGAGNAGSMIVREIQRNPRWGMTIVGFLDDDPNKYGMRIHGVPVLGGRGDIARVSSLHQISQLVIAMPSVGGSTIRELTTLSEQAGIVPKIIPSIYGLLEGTVTTNQLRDVDIEDLLRRDSIETDQQAINDLIQGRRVLITGGGGSIGSELCRQLWHAEPTEIILLGHGENSIFDIYHELARMGSGENLPTITAVIADVRFAERVLSVFKKHKPEVVFHAAAHKHVPLMESNPVEAITNNVFGTQNILTAALAVNVERFVMISTDKAVNPTSIMGASKRIAELLVHRAASQSNKPFVAVRFGNVLGSRGSVVWTFKKQIALGGPVTVTHPDMERFFMTIPEAVQLVLQAAVLGSGEEVFVLDMGEPVKIVDLAKDMIELSGLEVGKDIEISYSGLRPGEKLYEELFIPGELYARTASEKIFLAENAAHFVEESLITELQEAVKTDSKQSIMLAISHIVPEFNPPEWNSGAQIGIDSDKSTNRASASKLKVSRSLT